MKPTLTILLIEDVEKDPAFVDRFFFGLTALNADALSDIQVVAVSQREHSPELEAARSAYPGRCDVLYAEHPRAENGYPIWDVAACARLAWPMVEGEYVSFNHTEFLHGPGRLARTVEYLRSQSPTVALGNLRRLDHGGAHSTDRRLAPEKGICDIVTLLTDERESEWLGKLWGHFPTTCWPTGWGGEARTSNRWQEDLFYARRDWLDAMEFWTHGGGLPFQDVYDLMKEAIDRLGRHGLAPACPRMSREVSDAFHLNHTRPRSCYTLPVFHWFLDHESDWHETTVLRMDLWAVILNPKRTAKEIGHTVKAFRRAPGGTVTRFAGAFSAWLQGGGEERVRQYVARQREKEKQHAA
jgi:hypothetical protein